MVDQDNNSYHRSIGKRPIDADYSDMTEKLESSHKAPQFKVGDRVKISKDKNIFSKDYTENWTRKIFFINSVSYFLSIFGCIKLEI